MFHRSPVRLGRNLLNDLVLERPFVSQWHAEIEFDDGGIRYLDLGSTNGSRRDGQRLPSGHLVEFVTGQAVELGALVLLLERGGAPGEGENVPLAGGEGAEGGTVVAGTFVAKSGEVGDRVPAGGGVNGVGGMSGSASVGAGVGAGASVGAGPSAGASAGPGVAGVFAGALVPPRIATRRGVAAGAASAVVADDPRYATTDVSSLRRERTLIDAVSARTVVAPAQAPAAQPINVLAQMNAVSARLAPYYQAYQSAAAALDALATQLVEGTDPGSASLVFTVLEENFPALSERAAVRALAEARGQLLEGEAGVAAQALAGLNRLNSALSGGAARTLDAKALDALLLRTATVLLAFGASFVALQRGYVEFAQASGAPEQHDLPPELTRPTVPLHVLGYLYDPAREPEEAVEHLRRAFAGLMVHQVRLLSVMTQGVRRVLSRLSPAAIAGEGVALPVKSGLMGRLRAWRAGRPAALWQRFVARHAEFADENGEPRESVLGAGR